MTTVAIAGCPNGGKTTLFNRIAGARHAVGNWPGQTVDRHEGRFEVGGCSFDVVDLPGTYGLVAVSAEEEITARYLLERRPDVVVVVVDATNLGPGLHLLTQIAEMGLRRVVALNMWDVALRREMDIDVGALASAVGAPVIPTCARQGHGVGALKEAVAEQAVQSVAAIRALDYGKVVEEALSSLVPVIELVPGVQDLGSSRWIALQLLAGDEQVAAALEALSGGEYSVRKLANQTSGDVADAEGFGLEVALAERRFRWVTGVIESATGVFEERVTWSDRMDRVLTHRWLGLPVFLTVMWGVLRFISDVTAPYVDWIDGTISGPVGSWLASSLAVVSLDGGWVESLVVDGIMTGVGGVLAFVPVLIGLYLMLAILEDSGYMARAAAVMERMMRAVGVPGKAFLPMMVGFGCTVPAIYATRTLESPRDRLLTGLLTPFMSCGARLPVYVLLAGVFFGPSSGTVVFGMYLLGIVVALVIGRLLSRTILRDTEPTSFVMVMPDFRVPAARTVWRLVRSRTVEFVQGAGTVIFAASMAVWLLLAIPTSGTGSFAAAEPVESVFGGVSKLVAPIYAPAGFGDWEQSGSLITGFVAKEVVVSTMSQLYVPDEDVEMDRTTTFSEDLRSVAVGFLAASADTLRAVPGVFGLDYFDLSDNSSTHLRSAIETSFIQSSHGHGRAAGLAFMVFVLLYTPCMAAVAAFRHEFGTRWMWFGVLGQFAIAWLGAVLAFQVGRMLGL